MIMEGMCHQLRRILFILLSIYRKSRKIRYFGCRSKRLLFLIILLFSRLLDSSPLHPRLLSSNGLFLRENFIRIIHLHPRINDSFKDQLKIMQRSFLDQRTHCLAISVIYCAFPCSRFLFSPPVQARKLPFFIVSIRL